MRILHTSDWHLGRSFHREGMLGAPGGVRRPPARGRRGASGSTWSSSPATSTTARCPHVDAVRLADETLARLAASRAQVVLTSGNHDSAQRLGFSSRLIDAAGVFIRTDAGGGRHPGRCSTTSTAPVAVYGIPYLDPDAVARAVGAAGPVPRGGADRGDAAGPRRPARQPPAPGRSCWRTRSSPAPQPSDSERDISVGGVSLVPTTVFDGIDYAALGHLHGRHTLTDTVRYSGSPLAYSFSEADHAQGLLAGRPRRRRLRTAPSSSRRRSRGRWPGCAAPSTTCSPTRGSRRTRTSWVQATLTDDVRPLQAMERLRARFPHTLVLGFEPAGGDRRSAPGRAHRRAAPTTTSPSTSSPSCAARRRPTPRPALLRRPRATPAARTGRRRAGLGRGAEAR